MNNRTSVQSKSRMLLLLCTAFALLISLIYLNGNFQTAHNIISDQLQVHLNAPPSDRPIAYLLIDDASLIEAYEVDGISWPWPRSAYAEAIRFLRNAGAAAIVFDMVFTERSVHGIEDDRALADAIEGGPIVLATLSSSKPGGMSKSSAAARRTMVARFAIDLQSDDADPLSAHFIDRPYLRPPVAELAASTHAIGDVQFVQDGDGVGRRVPMLIRSGDTFYPSLSLAVASQLLHIDRYRLKGNELLLDGSEGMRRIPLDRDGMARPRYYGDSNIYDKYLLLRVIKSQLRIDEGEPPYYDPALFKGKIVIIGSDATELKDFRPTPFNKANDPGAHYHGNAIHSILAGDFLQARYAPRYVIPLLFASALIIALVAARYRAATAFSITFALLLLLFATAIWLFRYHGLLIDVAASSANLAGCFIVTTGYNYLAEARQRHFITSAFGQYLSPEVVDSLVADPDHLKLGGEVREITAFFSYIQGFSTISETLTPQALVTLLNEYLSEMCDIIGRHHGTVDKFEGDAIMAFWGAPLATDMHASQALAAAIEMQRRLAELRERWRAEGKPLLYVRMGINSGPMLVGNMGSRTRMNYTIMGDAVNLASRLEGANKFYGTYLMISEHTRALAGDAFATRELDSIRVMGRHEPVRVYELLGYRQLLAEQQLAAALLFEQALAIYRNGDFARAEEAFRAVIELAGRDSPSEVFLNRLQAMGDRAEGGWDGVFNADSKG